MGGEHDRLSAAEAASVLGWWIEAGVDVAIGEQPRDWTNDSASPPPPVDVPAAPAPEQDLPQNLDLFRDWLRSSPAVPFAQSGTRRILPRGVEQAEVMLIAEAPAAEDAAADQPIGGEAWELTQRMLAAIGIAAEDAYCAGISCIYSPGSRLRDKELEACAAIARRHVALARPKRLLLLGDGPSLALLGKPVATARGHVHKVEGVNAVVTFHPRHLLRRPSDKALAWRDLLLLMEDQA